MLKIPFVLILIATMAQPGSALVDASTCPAICNCSSQLTVSCTQCLEQYNRKYNITSDSCPCITQHIEMVVAGNYCCSTNCSVCSETGYCVNCPITMVLVKESLGRGSCVCRDNFFYDGTECICLSVISPSKYYLIESENSCLKCPEGCDCNEFGCVQCNNNTNRIVVTAGKRAGNMSVFSCHCSPLLA